MKIDEVKRLKGLCSGRYIVATTSPDKGRSFFPECQRPCPEYAAREVASISEIENAVRIAQTYVFTDLHGRTVYPEILDMETGESAGTWCLDCGTFVPVDAWHQHEAALPVGRAPAPASALAAGEDDEPTETICVYGDGTWDRIGSALSDRWAEDPKSWVLAVERGTPDGEIAAQVAEQARLRFASEPAPDPLIEVLDRDYATTEAQVIAERCQEAEPTPGRLRARQPQPAGEVDFKKLRSIIADYWKEVLVEPDGRWVYRWTQTCENPAGEDAVLLRFPATLTGEDIASLIDEATVPPAEPALLPCPFCGSTDPYVKETDSRNYSVFCRWCGANVGLWAERFQAITGWNARKPTTEKVK